MKIEFYIVTGISGAGKSQTLKCFEDLGFFCVDNLPVSLIPKFVEVCEQSSKLRKVVLGIDAREGELLDYFFDSLKKIKQSGYQYKIIFIDANDEVLIRRYSETRRRHPLGKNVVQGIDTERKKLREIRANADKVIDTSHLTLGELKEIVASTLLVNRPAEIQLNILSFGYKYGIPTDIDIAMDVRFLPNPNYLKRLKLHTGNEKPVIKYVTGNKNSRMFMNKFFPLIEWLLPHYIKEGKSYLTIGIGCTGGKHRAVVIANHLRKFLENKGYSPLLKHRDVDK